MFYNALIFNALNMSPHSPHIHTHTLKALTHMLNEFLLWSRDVFMLSAKRFECVTVHSLILSSFQNYAGVTISYCGCQILCCECALWPCRLVEI